MKMEMTGLSVIEGPRDLNRTRGRLSLPSGFDEKKYAVKWAKQGHGVAMAREREQISGTKFQADGWEVWMDVGRKPCIRTLSDGAYVLMVRPKVVQRNIAAVCGNLSRERLKNEANGRTVAGEAVEDHGMLTDSVLERFERKGVEDSNDELASLNLNELSREKITTSSRANKIIKSK